MIKPLSRYPTYHGDIDFKDIDLHALTHTFSFGEINGVASGHVYKLRLFDGIPSAFEARFETAEDGNRNISVKAIRNLNTLSQGGLSAALSQIIYRFIDFYRYRKIGMNVFSAQRRFLPARLGENKVPSSTLSMVACCHPGLTSSFLHRPYPSRR